MQSTIFIVYYIPDKFLSELSSHTTVALAQPQSQIVYSPSIRRSSRSILLYANKKDMKSNQKHPECKKRNGQVINILRPEL